ncbi:ABC transporter substrate-binding protein [Oscillospiraceae bacterium OttesenSCG-928-G22]|nr:ABC transporter substrate-binding protein [Oscillospiraceae bacterium OttesenSCG-928-G22]
MKVAYIGPATGDGAPWGIAEWRAIQILRDEINENGGLLGGRQLEVIQYDNRMDNIESANAARKAIQNDNVCAIVGSNASSNAIALAGVCNDMGVPQVATTATNYNVTMDDEDNVRPYTFRATIIDPQQGTMISDYAIDSLGITSAAVLYEIGSDYSVGLKDAFVANCEARGIPVLAVEAYKTGDVDFRSQLTKINQNPPDALFLPALYKEIGLIANQARGLGLEATFLGGDSWSSTDLIGLAGASVEGSYFVMGVNLQDPALDSFKAEYLERYGDEAGAEGGNCFFGYDALLMVVKAIEKAGSDDREKIRDALEALEGVEGLTKTITINPETHNPATGGVIFVAHEDGVEFVTRME